MFDNHLNKHIEQSINQSIERENNIKLCKLSFNIFFKWSFEKTFEEKISKACNWFQENQSFTKFSERKICTKTIKRYQLIKKRLQTFKLQVLYKRLDFL